MESGSKISIKKFILLMIAFVLPWILVFVIGETSIGYSISINDKCIAYIKCKSDLNNVFDDMNLGSSDRDKLKDKIKYNIICSNRENFISGEELKNNILSVMDIPIKAYVIKVDGNELCYVKDENKGKYIIDNIKQHYIDSFKSDKDYIVACDVKNKISYEPVELKAQNIKSENDLINEVIGSETQKSMIKFEIKISKKEQVDINPNLSIKTSMDMEIGSSKVQDEGEKGSKERVKESVYLNNTLINEKVISEKLIKEPKDKVVVKGAKIPVDKEVAFIEKPSRGVVTSNFGERWGSVHQGIDIAGNTGDPIKAPLDGNVTYSSWMDGYGYVVILDHGNGLETRYGHCSKLNVKKGDTVKKDSIIALIGSTGRSTGPHLHFEVRRNGRATNPINYIIK